eukprot:CAMPEP_0196773250 /NCGR_PEP_ID=MMETSP1104-20130614/2660_1 /TAXON_ID=33652 /ORGANISM="Cafeteria sp., Strain Caron Lab Isolate" /LENGTH=142 /DNA_ID=CAMNT_0042143395 /DNA_START=35 /DNA_END=463 /DNA_ORIENTATION=-
MGSNRGRFSMSQPPDYVNDEDFRNIADCRRATWNGGFSGLGIGALSGAGAYFGLRAMKSYIPPKYRVQAKHGMLFTIGSACFGAFVGSLTSAKNHSHLLEPVLKKARGDEAYSHYEKLQRRFHLKSDIASQVAGRPEGDGER